MVTGPGQCPCGYEGDTCTVSIAINTYRPSVHPHVSQPLNRYRPAAADPYVADAPDIRYPAWQPPRPYQVEAVTAGITAVQAGRRGMVVQPTGTGKTYCEAGVAPWCDQAGLNTLTLSHTREIISQRYGKYRDFGLDASIERGQEHRAPADTRHVIASVPTLQGRRRARFGRDHFDVIILDECKHGMARTYRDTHDYFDGARCSLGFDATPVRYDKQSLLHLYPDGIIYQYVLMDAVLNGYLVPPKAVRLSIAPDLRQCRVHAGDWVEADIAVALGDHQDAIARRVVREIDTLNTLVFAPNVAFAQEFAARLRALGVRAEAVWGTCKDRDHIVARFRAGTTQVCVNVGRFGEGFDSPQIACVVLLRPTQSWSLFAQQIGRGLRPFPGKTLLLVIDFTWITKHKHLVMDLPELLLQDEPAAVQVAVRKIGGEPVDAIRRARRIDLAGLNARAYTRREEAWLLDPPAEVLARTATLPEWLRPTVKQVRCLKDLDIRGWERMNRSEASAAIEVGLARRDRGLANYTLVRTLAEWGLLSPEQALKCTERAGRDLLAREYYRTGRRY